MIDSRTPEEKRLDEDAAELDAKLGGPNPELYERLSQPQPTLAAANDSINRFLIEVKRLREEFGVPEVLILAAAHYTTEEAVGGESKIASSVKACAFGSHEYRAQLGALAFQQYTAPEIERAEELRRLATARPR